MTEGTKKEFPRLKTVDRLSKLPVVETGYQYASVIYTKIKNSNFLIRWGLGSVEGTVFMVLDKSLVAIPLIQMPLNVVDDIVCKGLAQVEQRVPAITYPPELLVNLTKDYVSSKFIQPVLKRADSVKQLGLNGASKYGEMAVSRLDNALDVADKYVDKYLPDAVDGSDTKETINQEDNNKAKQAMEHVSRLSRKLKRRLTRRTLAEARALRQQGVNTMQFFLYLADLLVRDPKQFMEKINEVWAYLSEDEPENQVPPANLEQLVVMISREMARRFVHTTNFTLSMVSLMPKYTLHAFHITSHHLRYIVDYLLKEALWSHLKCGSKVDEEPALPLVPIPSSGAITQNSDQPTKDQNKTEKEVTKTKEEIPIKNTLDPKAQNNSESFNFKKDSNDLLPNGDIAAKKIN